MNYFREGFKKDKEYLSEFSEGWLTFFKPEHKGIFEKKVRTAAQRVLFEQDMRDLFMQTCNFMAGNMKEKIGARFNLQVRER